MDNEEIEAFDADLEKIHIEGLWKLYGAAADSETVCVEMVRDSTRPKAGGRNNQSRTERGATCAAARQPGDAEQESNDTYVANVISVGKARRNCQSAPPHDCGDSFGSKGQGAFTTVDGAKYEMAPGDLILTPSWSWHDHGNESSEAIIWVDGLDSPLVHFLGVGFFEHFSQDRQPVTRRGEALLDGSGYLRPPASLGSETLPVS